MRYLTTYDSHPQHFDTSAVEAVSKLVMEYNPKAIMVIKSTILVDYPAAVREKFNSKNIIFSSAGQLFQRVGYLCRDERVEYPVDH